MDPNSAKVHLITHPNLIGYYLQQKGTKRAAALLMPGNARAEFNPDSYVALQEQRGKTIPLQNAQAIYNELRALYLKQQQTAKL